MQGETRIPIPKELLHWESVVEAKKLVREVDRKTPEVRRDPGEHRGRGSWADKGYGGCS